MSPTLIGPDGNASEVMAALNVERRRRGWSMADTEEWIGVSTSAWFQWKLGRPPRFLCLIDLLEGFSFGLVLADEQNAVAVQAPQRGYLHESTDAAGRSDWKLRTSLAGREFRNQLISRASTARVTRLCARWPRCRMPWAGRWWSPRPGHLHM